MTCRHGPNDPSCSSYPPTERLADLKKEEAALRKEFKLPDTPDSEDFEVLEYAHYSPYMVLQVRYPSCASCAYEGTKILVYAGVGIKDVLRWKKIDPHFRELGKSVLREAPPPIARFPGSKQGWDMAVRYAAWLQDPK